MNLTSTIAPIPIVISKTRIGSVDPFFSSILFISLPSTKANFNPSFSDVRDMVLSFALFLFSFVEPFKKILSQFPSSPSKGNR